MSKAFYDPTPETLGLLANECSSSFSGGKDSSCLVSWIEWLRRAGWVTIQTPKLVQSNTGVEDPKLQAVSEKMMGVLRASGWQCVIVTPPIHKRLYNSILGRGVPPIHPGIRNMRWCTNGTKIEPMQNWREENGGKMIVLTGRRKGESAIRDEKIARSSCAAGGECGIPDQQEWTRDPILHWTTCNVIDWLNGAVRKDVRQVMGDVFAVTKELVGIYGVSIGQPTFDWDEPEITAARFGCAGCPAIEASRYPRLSVARRNGGADAPINDLYGVWFDARLPKNRIRHGYKLGPIRMSVRQELFERVMSIQSRSGVTLVTAEDEAFIRGCWEHGTYPRGTSEEDEDNDSPSEPLFIEDTP